MTFYIMLCIVPELLNYVAHEIKIKLHEPSIIWVYNCNFLLNQLISLDYNDLDFIIDYNKQRSFILNSLRTIILNRGNLSWVEQ